MKQIRRIARFFGAAVAFIKESWEELKRTHRPSREELIGFTVVVLISIGVVAFYVGVLDLVFRSLASIIYSRPIAS